MSMTKKDADATLGSIVYEDDRYVVRASRKGEEMAVYVHKKVDGHECVPLGYWLGSNSLLTGS